MNYLVQACTDIGIAKQTNQDSFVAKVINTSSGRMMIAVMCDGMGGLEKGEVASATLVSAFNRWIQEVLLKVKTESLHEDFIKQQWTNLILENNEKIKVYGKKCGVSLGTTVTAILLTDTLYYIVNVGDTRVYEISRQGQRIITKDHTVVYKEVEQGIITEEQAHIDPRRSVLLQCVGASEQVYPDFFFGVPIQNAVYMLCTDGFRHEILPEEIYHYLQPDNMVNQEVMKNNILTLIELDKQRNERDNISVITVRTY